MKTTWELKSLVLVTVSVLVAHTATYPSFFVFNPFASQINIVLAIVQTFALIAWPLLVFGFPSVFFLRKQIGVYAKPLLRVCAVNWPAAVFLVHFVLFLLTQDPSMGYLVQYPAFLVSDIVIPIVYWRIASRFA